ncbi:hypothetical protein XA68_15112 [Ophiocordyceps unilateralis]|uniref:SCP domain-containing protein n=1 Tax=Ophiocordyceps unilateralis TaxID=268505 RepID=A0A2A9P9B1_OPHUN|nr:hypothetical protein XA68_15112 [Ophiocordyceps unilateralis]
MQVTLLLTLALSLASAHPFPAGPEAKAVARRHLLKKTIKHEISTRASGLQPREAKEKPQEISDDDWRQVNSILKQYAGISLDDDNVDFDVVQMDKLPDQAFDQLESIVTSSVGNEKPDKTASSPSRSESPVAASPRPEPPNSASFKPKSSKPASPGVTSSEPPLPNDNSDGPIPQFKPTDPSEYLSIVNHWRSVIGIKQNMTVSTSLEANALAACRQSSSSNLQHTQDPGEGQVLAPGPEKSFEYVFVGGWLCEMPSLPGISQACDVVRRGVPGETPWLLTTETGHARLLSDPSFTKIGCANANNVWGCNLGN